MQHRGCIIRYKHDVLLDTEKRRRVRTCSFVLHLADSIREMNSSPRSHSVVFFSRRNLVPPTWSHRQQPIRDFPETLAGCVRLTMPCRTQIPLHWGTTKHPKFRGSGQGRHPLHRAVNYPKFRGSTSGRHPLQMRNSFAYCVEKAGFSNPYDHIDFILVLYLFWSESQLF